MNVLFLDIDGVLNKFLPGHPQFDRSCLTALSEVLRETGCSTVLSSSWRQIIHRGDMTLSGFATMLHTHGLYGLNLIDVTRPCDELSGRGKQIRRWLADHRASRGIESYCVLDDDDDGISELHSGRFVRTDGREGLTMDNAQEAIRILTQE